MSTFGNAAWIAAVPSAVDMPAAKPMPDVEPATRLG
jgi:hypothetical protein